MKTLQLLLRDKHTLFAHMRTKSQWMSMLVQLAIISLASFAAFGASMDIFHGDWLWSLKLSGKTVVLFWATCALTAPSLAVFTALRGSRIDIPQILALLVGSLATSGIVLAALLPITWFFAWTDTTHTGTVVRLIHIFAFFIAAFFGAQHIKQGMQAFHAEERKTDPHHASASDVLLLWLVLVVIVGIQMAHKIGPWYAEDTQKICTKALVERSCLPFTTHGTPAQGIVVENTIATWIPGDTQFNADEIHYLVYGKLGENHWETQNATCALNNNRTICSFDFSTQQLTAGTYIIQAIGPRDQFGQEYVTQPFTMNR